MYSNEFDRLFKINQIKLKLLCRTHNWLTIAYVLVIVFISIAPTNSHKQVDLSSTTFLSIRSDYLLHALLFAPWMTLIQIRWPKKKDIGFFIKVLAIGLLFAAVSEGVQLLLPYRSFNLVDLGANCLGVVAGAFISGLGKSRLSLSRHL